MERIELKPSGVIFNEEAHEYWLDGQKLSGITEALKSILHPDMYQGIPEAVIRQAGDYGNAVHKDIYDFDHSYSNCGSQEVADYISICKGYGLVHEASEFTVTDGHTWASNIDKVYRVSDDTFSLGDIKTYGKLTPEKLELARYQLSCYAWMLQLGNPGIKIDKLFIIHLRNKTMKSGKVEHISEIVFVDRIPSFICEEVLGCYLTGEKFNNPYAIPVELASQEQHIRELIATKAAVDEELSQIKSNILTTMVTMDVKSWLTDGGMKITRKVGSTRSSFDLTKFKKDYPDMAYDQYQKVSKVSDSLVITL